MSTIKSSAENLTLNADGANNDIKFQSNGTEVASIDQSGNLAVSGTVDGVDIQTLNSAVSANTAKVTNATHTGDVTGATALTIADNIIDEANLKVSNAPTNGYMLTAQSGNTGGLTWAAASGGGGAMEFISKSTVSSNVTSVDFTSLSGYNTYKLIFDCHTTSTSFLKCQIYDGGSLVTTNNAYDSRIRYNGSNSTGQSQVMWYIHRHDAAGNVFGELTFTVLSDRVNVRAKTGASSGSDTTVSDMVGSTDPTEDSIGSFDGIRIYPHNNNITSGTFSLYGIKDS